MRVLSVRSVFACLIIFMAWTAVALAENGDDTAIQNCLEHWKTHPFHSAHPGYRVLSTKVKVLGIGGNNRDDKATAKPDLVLVKPNVTVLSRSDLDLLNPNGWYCLKTGVAVLGKSVVNLHCKAKLASSVDGATIMGGSDREGSVNVLGSTRLNRVDCP